MMLDHRAYAGQLASLADSTEVRVGDISRSETLAEIAVDVLKPLESTFAYRITAGKRRHNIGLDKPIYK